MRKCRTKRSRRPKRRPDEASPAAAPARDESPSAGTRPGPAYGAGPVVRLGTGGRDVPAATPLAAVSGRGEPDHDRAFSGGTPLRLRGRTDAHFDGGSFFTEGVTVTTAAGCRGCAAGDCVRVRGTLVTTCAVTTTVTLPKVSDYPGLTACQKVRVQDAIDNVLAPHEQKHVDAYATYNGTTRRAFDLTLCRGAFDDQIRALFRAEEQARRDAARSASAALDPFSYDVDLGCQDRPARAESTVTAGAAGVEAPP